MVQGFSSCSSCGKTMRPSSRSSSKPHLVARRFERRSAAALSSTDSMTLAVTYPWVWCEGTEPPPWPRPTSAAHRHAGCASQKPRIQVASRRWRRRLLGPGASRSWTCSVSQPCGLLFSFREPSTLSTPVCLALGSDSRLGGAVPAFLSDGCREGVVRSRASGSITSHYRRCPSGNPRSLAFMRNAGTVRLVSFEIFATGVLAREWPLSSWTCCFVQG
jgi:hypothetical protein